MSSKNRFLTVKEFEEECRKADQELISMLSGELSTEQYKQDQIEKNKLSRSLLDQAETANNARADSVKKLDRASRAIIRGIQDDARDERTRLLYIEQQSHSAPLPDDNRPLRERLAEFDLNLTSEIH